MSEQTPEFDQTAQVNVLAAPTPHHVAAWRNEDPARRIYPNNAEFSELIPDTAFDGAEVGVSAEKRQAAITNLRAMLADTGLAPAEARGLFNRAAVVREEGRSAEQQRSQTRREFARVYGEEADQALADVRKLVGRDPRFAKFLEGKGLGNDAETLLLLARAARSQRLAGRLK